MFVRSPIHAPNFSLIQRIAPICSAFFVTASDLINYNGINGSVMCHSVRNVTAEDLNQTPWIGAYTFSLFLFGSIAQKYGSDLVLGHAQRWLIATYCPS
jgi:hypothetical protein